MTIYSDMMVLPGYDYFSEYRRRIEKNLPVKVKKQINANIESFYPLRSVNITPEDLKPVIEHVFVAEYKEDLKDWIGAIEKIEDKGYGRDEILSYLAQEPVSSWQKLAGRLAPKNKVK